MSSQRRPTVREDGRREVRSVALHSGFVPLSAPA